jgi:hypothetical protein
MGSPHYQGRRKLIYGRDRRQRASANRVTAALGRARIGDTDDEALP